jgi:hypothetical protein
MDLGDNTFIVALSDELKPSCWTVCHCVSGFILNFKGKLCFFKDWLASNVASQSSDLNKIGSLTIIDTLKRKGNWSMSEGK